jgi:glucosamine--fructose-6-phosphate aminotransferase (isomerizing)
MTGFLTHRELFSQPDVWSSVVDDADRISRAERFVRRTGVTRAAVIGCGSSFYLAQVAAAALSRAGLSATALPASEALFAWGDHLPEHRTLLIAVSRSGETTEALWAVAEHLSGDRGPVLAFTCEGDSSLANLADHAVVLDEAREESFVMTRAFSSMLLAALLLAGKLEGRSERAYATLPELCSQVLAASEALFGTESVAQVGEQLFVLGSGCAYGIAQEGALKIIEISLSPAHAYHHLELRHGPKSIVDQRALIVSLATPDVAAHEPPLAHELEGLGATVLRIGSIPGSLHVPIPQAPDAPAEALLRLPPVQVLALHRARAHGLEPDQPRHLDAVVRLAG